MTDSEKPRICEVLGVEPLEEWTADNVGTGELFRISENGTLEREGNDGLWYMTLITATMMVEIINHPENIKRKPRWTEQDIEDAKAIKRLFPGIEMVKRFGGGLGIYLNANSNYRYVINDSLFPTLGKGESAALDEIIGGGERD